MNDAGEEVALELEALAITYGDSVSSESQEAGVVKIIIQLTPRGVEDDPRLAFVSATLVLEAGRDYPASAGPTVSLVDVKGLSESSLASILKPLQDEASCMPGELVLGHLCELALDLITEHNFPEGECCFCLEPLLSNSPINDNGALGPSPAYNVTKLECFHAFHSSCFSAWFKWKQNCLKQREIQLKEEYKSMAPSYLVKEGIWSEEVAFALSSTSADAPEATTSSNPKPSLVQRIFAVRCPQCRCEVPPKDLAAALPLAPPPPVKASENTPANSLNKDKSIEEESIWDAAAHPSPSKVLQPESLKQLHDLQRRFAEVLRVQTACHGLVEESIAVSLGDIQAAVENDRAMQAAASNLESSGTPPDEGAHIKKNNNRSSSTSNGAQQQGRGRWPGGRVTGERIGGGGVGGRGQKTAGDRGRRGGRSGGRWRDSEGRGTGKGTGDSGSKESTKQQSFKAACSYPPL